jgi:hypothetical protein
MIDYNNRQNEIKSPENVIDKESFYSVDWLYRRASLSKEFILAVYEFYYNMHKKELGFYFQYLYNIFKYIIEENQNKEDIRRYLNIVQSQMSSDELGLLFYYALSKYSETKNGEKQFYSWLEEYDFLENMDSDSLMEREHHKYYKTKFKFLNEEEKKQ